MDGVWWVEMYIFLMDLEASKRENRQNMWLFYVVFPNSFCETYHSSGMSVCFDVRESLDICTNRSVPSPRTEGLSVLDQKVRGFA